MRSIFSAVLLQGAVMGDVFTTVLLEVGPRGQRLPHVAVHT